MKNKNIFEILLAIGLVMFIYTGISSGISAFIDDGFITGIRVMFDPTIFSPFWAMFTLVQDVFLIVGIIGTIVMSKKKSK